MRTPRPSYICAALIALLFALECRAQQQAGKTLFPVEKNDKWGFIDRTGKIVIPLQFNGANDFHEGLALVTANGKKLFVDTFGHVVIRPQFDTGKDDNSADLRICAPFSEGVAAIHNCDQTFFIDKTGKTVISGNFKYASSFSGGLAGVETMTENGLLESYIDKTGKTVWEAPK